MAAKVETYRKKMLASVDNGFHTFMGNYIKVKFLNTRFPWFPYESNFIATFLFCLLPYALIQLLLAVKSHNASLSDEDIIKVVYKVEQRLDHTIKLYNLFKRNPKYLDMDQYLSCLRML